MKTSLPGVRPGCLSRHSTRRLATSGRSCSAARSDFFYMSGRARPASSTAARCWPKPDASGAARPAIRPAWHGLCRKLGADRVIQISQLRRQMPALRQRCGLPGAPPPAQHLRDVGDTDPQQDRDPPDRLALIRRGKHPLAQILRIRFPPLPKHLRPLRLVATGGRCITDETRFDSPQIPVSLKML